METTKIDEKIAKCVKRAFQKIGKNIDKTIFYYLKRDFNVEKLDIAEKPETFEKAIVSIFGELGAKVIMRLILTEIEETFNMKQVSNLTFGEVVAMVKSYQDDII